LQILDKSSETEEAGFSSSESTRAGDESSETEEAGFSSSESTRAGAGEGLAFEMTMHLKHSPFAVLPQQVEAINLKNL
jgi:hypothetical protein